MNRIGAKVKVLPAPTMTAEEQKFAVELSHLIGFYSVSYQFPALIATENADSADLCFVIGGEYCGEQLVEEGFAVYRNGNRIHIHLQGHAAEAYQWISEQYETLLGIELYPRRCRAVFAP